MIRRFFLTGVGVNVAVAALAGCADSASPAGPIDGGDGDTLTHAPDSGAAVDAGEGGSAIGTTLRLAHLSPDLGPIDFCYRVASAEWVGPVFAAPSDAGAPTDAASSDARSDTGGGDAGASDAAPDGGGSGPPSGTLAFANVTSYLTVRGSGTFDIALVTAGERSCGRPRAIGHVTLDPGKRATVVIMGSERADAGSLGALTVAAFTDAPTVVSGLARTRFIHAALGDSRAPPLGALSAAVVAGSTFALATAIPPGHAAISSASAPDTDGFGYHAAAPILEPSALRIEAAQDAGGGSWLTDMGDLRMTAGSLHTGFLVTDAPSGLAVLWCNDPSSARTSVATTECWLWKAR